MGLFNRRACFTALLVVGVIFQVSAQQSGVLVKTALPQKGELPDIVTAIGSVMPAVDGGMTIGTLHDGRATAIRVTPGERVKSGQPLVDILASATVTSNYSQATSALSLAEAQRVHAQQLFSQQLATRDQVGLAEKAVRDAQSALDALKAQGAGEAVQTISAPFDGIVTAIVIAQGDRLVASAPLMTLTRNDGFIAAVGVEPKDVFRIAAGQSAELLSVEGGPPLQGKVRRVDSILNARTRMVDVDIAIPAGSAMSGQAMKASIQVGTVSGWRLPRSAVLKDANGAYIFQVAGGKAARLQVQIKASVGDEDLVTGNLDAQKLVVIEGANQLDDGAAVRLDTAGPAGAAK